MKCRAVLLVACAVVALATTHASGQSLPLGGFDFSAWNDIAVKASRNETESVKSLLVAGNTPDTTDTNGQTPLGYAASFGNTEMTQALLKYNAPVESDAHDAGVLLGSEPTSTNATGADDQCRMRNAWSAPS